MDPVPRQEAEMRADQPTGFAAMPLDSDVDLDDPNQRGEMLGHHVRVLLAIAAGGVIGSLARYQLGVFWPTPATGFPWVTLAINVLGCLLIGVLMVLVTGRDRTTETAHPLVRPFLGTGVLGGFTTFSTYTVDIHRLLADGRVLLALGYLAGTAAAAIAAVAIGMVAALRLSAEPSEGGS